MDSRVSFLIYVAVKFAAYAAWCGFGVRLVANQKPRLATALGYGLVRLLLGVFFGVGIFIVGAMMHLTTPGNPWPLYFGIYAPVRWVEWSIMATIIATGKLANHFFSEQTTTRGFGALAGLSFCTWPTSR